MRLRPIINRGVERCFHTYRYPLCEVLPSLDELARHLHMEGDVEHPAYHYMQQRLAELAASTLETIGGYVLGRVERIDTAAGIVTVEGCDFSVGVQVCGYLKEAEEAALFLCTAGALFSDEAHALNEQGEFLEAYIIDTIGSMTVEHAMDRIHRALAEEQAGRGLKITNRYSPGYCNWPLVDQRALFAFVGENPTGIVLSDSCLMHPIKSVSGIIGIGAKARRRAYGCVICQNKTCIYRKIVAREQGEM